MYFLKTTFTLNPVINYHILFTQRYNNQKGTFIYTGECGRLLGKALVCLEKVRYLIYIILFRDIIQRKFIFGLLDRTSLSMSLKKKR
jgi:hypothetical protein